MSIRVRLILAFAACVALAVGITCAIVFYFVTANEEQNFHAMAVSQLERVGERINAYMEPGIHAVGYLAGLSVVRESRGKLTDYSLSPEPTLLEFENMKLQGRRIYVEFLRVVQASPYILRVFLGEEDRGFVQAPDGVLRPAGYDPVSRPWYLSALRDPHEITFSEPYVNSDNFMVCSIMGKVKDERGRFLGVLGLDYRLKVLLADLDSRQINATGRLVIIDPSGRILSDGLHPERTFRKAAEVSELWSAVADGPDGAFTGEGADGREKYIVSSTLANLNWKMAVVFDRSELMASSFSILRALLLTAGAVLLIATLAGALLSRSIVRPMEQLVEASKIISQGEHERSEATLFRLQELLDVSGSGEVQELSLALTSLIITLEQRVDEARAASRAKSNFMANMSHEIRTPMNAIMGFTHLLLKGELTAKQRDYGEKVYKAAKTLLTIIDDILDFSKIESGTLTVRKTPFFLKDVLDRVSELFERHSKAKRIPLFVQVNPDVPQLLSGDPRRLYQIMVNLVDNAFKFTETGQIYLRVARLADDDDPDSLTLKFSVIDTGIGMNPIQLREAFTPFSQADSSSTRKYGGIGLGLPLTRSLARIMGGSIEIASEEGKGTTASLLCKFERDRTAESVLADPEAAAAAQFVPDDYIFADDEPPTPVPIGTTDPARIMASLEAARENAAATTAADPADLTDLRGYRVLLVEDNELNVLLAEEILHSAGIVTATAYNGEEALRLIDEAVGHGFRPAFDAVLMDLQMPVLDGYATVERIRANPIHAGLIIIAMTAHAMEEERQRSLLSGMNEHLTKPIDAAELYATLRRFLVKPGGAKA